MIKYRRIHSTWTKKEALFLSKYNIKVTEGYDSFDIEEQNLYRELKKKNFGKINSLFSQNKNIVSDTILGCEFSIDELDSANYFVLLNFGKPKGYPLPTTGDIFGYLDVTREKYCKHCAIYVNQPNPFRIKSEPKWAKNQVNFSLNWIFDEMFFKKEFFQEVLQPLGLKSRNVNINTSEKIAKTVVQLVIPEAKSKLLIDNTIYNTEKPCENCGYKKYSQQILDFFPPFEKKFDFLICKTQESFGETGTQMAYRRIIISKKFCEILANHKIIKYNTFNIFPLKNK